MKAIYRLILDMQHPSRENILAFKQRDHKSREIDFTLLNGGTAMDMTGVLLATIKGIKPGGDNVIYADAVIVTDDSGNTNHVTYELDDSVVDTAGRYTFVLELLDNESAVLTSFEFYVEIESHLYDEDDYVSESDLSGFRSYMVRALNATEAAENVERRFDVAYGSVEEAVRELEETESKYAATLADLEEKVETGYFIGPQGAQGENGKDAIVTDLEGLFALEIVEENLVLHYGGYNPPDLAIVGDELIWTWEDE